jgi:hypothetical protein
MADLREAVKAAQCNRRVISREYEASF